MHPCTSVVLLCDPGAYVEHIGVCARDPHEHLSVEHTNKKAQMCPSMHGVHGDREERVTLPSTYVVVVLTHQAPQ